VGFNDLATTQPKIAEEADGWDPTTVTAGSNKVLPWKCAKGHKWKTQVSSRSRGNNCPVCGTAKVLQGFNDLQTLNPTLAKEAFGWEPTEFRPGSRQVLSWKCATGHIWKASIVVRSNGGQCPVCDSFLIKFPELAKEADGWDPSTEKPGTAKKLKWKCPIGHHYTATGFSRARGGKCPVCQNRMILPGYNDLETTHPEIAKFALGWDPSKYGSGSREVLEWRCEKRHTWRAAIYVRVRNQNCAYCSGDLLWRGFNDLQTTHPEIAKEAHEWSTDSLMAGSRKKMKWICLNGHIWSSAVYTRTRKSRPSGCPTCAESGFDPNADGYFYFLTHQGWEMFQIGITNDPDRRIAKHKRSGWELLELRGPIDGHLSRQWETAILRMLKAKGADLSNDKIAGKFDGYSEAWSKSTFEVSSIKELMRLTEEFESE
jgi:hypothetical protein